MTEPMSETELKSLRPGERFWWVCPPIRSQNKSAKVEGPMILARFSKKDMGGWSTDTIEYRSPDGNIYHHFIISLTNGNWGVFRAEEDAQAYLNKRWNENIQDSGGKS